MFRPTLFACSLVALGLAGSPAGAEVATELLNHDREKVKEISSAGQETAPETTPETAGQPARDQAASEQVAKAAQGAATQACRAPQDPAAIGEQRDQLARDRQPLGPREAWQASH